MASFISKYNIETVEHLDISTAKPVIKFDFNIAPEWTYVPEGKTSRFTLIFAPLPKSCEFFDLLEDIPETGGFFIQNIKRNKSDVYHVLII
jgi:hypothetical protein